MKQLAIVATLRSGAEDQARRLIELGPPFDPRERGFKRHTVFLSANDVVFVFEGVEVEWTLDDLVDDQFAWVFQAALEAWRPLIEGEPRMARAAYAWPEEPRGRKARRRQR
jgi:hypothetical protein